MMFSGGLDSLAGAIEEIVVKKRKVALVNHQSTPKFNRRYGELCQRLMEKAGEMRPVHARMTINKSQDLNNEYTQRSRSFLYASLGATVAMMLDLRKLCFYENGVVSLNLPVCAQVVGGRATRTTHPRVLAGFQNLLSLLADEPFTVENPFLWKTKGEVVKIITAAECGLLIERSRSCAHTWENTNEHPHCGVCSQCIDRRFGIIAAKAEAFDPVAQYKVDVFTQSPPKDEDKIMGAAYLEKAIQCENLKEVPQFITDNPEVMRVLRYIEGTRAGVTGAITKAG
ncbi:MAG: 7-cyano-7-deazaguanine synthase [Limisphaerales bacterium]